MMRTELFPGGDPGGAGRRTPWGRRAFPAAFLLVACGPGTPSPASSQTHEVAGNPAVVTRYAGADAQEVLQGKASYYHDSLAGNTTANGDVYDPQAYTAASRDLPFGSIVRVTRVDNGAQVLVRINDRGPFRRHERILDLSRAAAESLDMIRAGVVRIRAEIVHTPE